MSRSTPIGAPGPRACQTRTGRADRPGRTTRSRGWRRRAACGTPGRCRASPGTLGRGRTPSARCRPGLRRGSVPTPSLPPGPTYTPGGGDASPAIIVRSSRNRRQPSLTARTAFRPSRSPSRWTTRSRRASSASFSLRRSIIFPASVSCLASLRLGRVADVVLLFLRIAVGELAAPTPVPVPLEDRLNRLRPAW